MCLLCCCFRCRFLFFFCFARHPFTRLSLFRLQFPYSCLSLPLTLNAILQPPTPIRLFNSRKKIAASSRSRDYSCFAAVHYFGIRVSRNEMLVGSPMGPERTGILIRVPSVRITSGDHPKNPLGNGNKEKFVYTPATTSFISHVILPPPHPFSLYPSLPSSPPPHLDHPLPSMCFRVVVEAGLEEVGTLGGEDGVLFCSIHCTAPYMTLRCNLALCGIVQQLLMLRHRVFRFRAFS